VGSVSAGVGACRANASAMRCCACCGVKTWRRSRGRWAPAATLTGWQDTFVAAGEASLATRSTDGEALETERLKAKLGEMLLERELLDAKIAALEANRPLARRRSRP
jgi:transposase